MLSPTKEKEDVSGTIHTGDFIDGSSSWSDGLGPPKLFLDSISLQCPSCTDCRVGGVAVHQHEPNMKATDY